MLMFILNDEWKLATKLEESCFSTPQCVRILEGIQDKIRDVMPNGNKGTEDFDNVIKISGGCVHDM